MLLTEKRIQSFFSRVDKTDYCWNFTGSLSTHGYGRVRYRSIDDPNRTIETHRFSWLLHKGEIPEGLFVCHKCDNRRCVNPEHLFLGTPKDNIEDMLNKGRGNNPMKDLDFQSRMVELSRLPNAIEKKKDTYKSIEHQQGVKNTQYGTMWITNGTENKKIKKESVLPYGWYKGRVV